MKKVLFLAVASLINSTSSFAQILDLDRILDRDLAYIAQIEPILKQVSEIQIGGTQTYGNKTIFKAGPNRGKLNPSILIINPDGMAHASSDNPQFKQVLGLKENGFSLDVWYRLKGVLDKYGRKILRIYINNVGVILPIAEDLPDGISDIQNQMMTGAKMSHSKLIESLYQYLFLVHGKGETRYSLYGIFFDLLEEGGNFTFKSNSFEDLKTVFSNSFLYKGFKLSSAPKTGCQHCLGCMLKALSCSQDIDIIAASVDGADFKNAADSLLYQKVLSQLPHVDKIYYLNEIEKRELREFPDSEKTAFSMQNQFRILSTAGFKNLEVGFGRLKSWGWGSKPEAYSVIIQGTK